MADGASEPTTDDRDSPWKEALDQYLEPALRLLFPSVHAQIDWSRGWQSLDGELQKVVRDAEVGRRLADKLFRVFLRGGGEVWVALHLEVQGEVDQGLGSRVHVYNYRIADRYDVPVASLVVLADDRPDWRPTAFEAEVLGCRRRLEFPTVKLLDFEPRRAELLADPNPFALVVLAHLSSLATRKAPEERLNSRWTLTRALYERGYEREDVLELLRFLDWLLALPPAQEALFAARHERFEQERHMVYKMKFELEAEARGLEKGLERGRDLGRRTLVAVLEARFQAPLPPALQQRLAEVKSAERLETLARLAAVAPTLDEFTRGLGAKEPTTDAT